MWLKTISIVAGAAALAAAPAYATIDKRWYVSLEAGWNNKSDVDFSAFQVPSGATSEGTLSFDDGWLGLLSAGYAFENNWRVELELGYRKNDLDGVCFVGAPCLPTFGEATQFTQMLNVIYDWRLADQWTLSTGLGIGGDYVEAKSLFGNDNDYVFAAQALVGLNYHINPRMDAFLNYRYLNTQEATFTARDPFIGGEINTLGVDRLENHSVTVGLRWDLYPTRAAAPPKVVQPEPMRQPARQYIVFFGFNKANLTAEAQAVVAEAAAAAKQMGTASILVTGHTDTVGSNRYNQRLSERRANVVREELQRLGAQGKIVTVGKGETELLVQTGDGVKEPQNRRTTIDLQ